MSDVTVLYRRYITDPGHHHWSDDSVSFTSVDEARAFIADLDQQIADGDTNIRAGRIVTTSKLHDGPSRTRGYRSSADPFAH